MANGRRDIELDPRFLVPPGVIDVRQENREDWAPVYNDSSSDITVDPSDGPILEFPSSLTLNAPSTYKIVSQTIRTAADGRTVVDVLLEFPDNQGIFDIDVKVTPT